MKLLGADANLSAKAELSAIGKAGRRIDIDGCRVNPVQKFLGVIVILRDDRLIWRIASSRESTSFRDKI